MPQRRPWLCPITTPFTVTWNSRWVWWPWSCSQWHRDGWGFWGRCGTGWIWIGQLPSGSWLSPAFSWVSWGTVSLVSQDFTIFWRCSWGCSSRPSTTRCRWTPGSWPGWISVRLKSSWKPWWSSRVPDRWPYWSPWPGRNQGLNSRCISSGYSGRSPCTRPLWGWGPSWTLSSELSQWLFSPPHCTSFSRGV